MLTFFGRAAVFVKAEKVRPDLTENKKFNNNNKRFVGVVRFMIKRLENFGKLTSSFHHS